MWSTCTKNACAYKQAFTVIVIVLNNDVNMKHILETCEIKFIFLRSQKSFIDQGPELYYYYYLV